MLKSVQEYNDKYHANIKYSGFGFETTIHHPCPACAEPDFMVNKLTETMEALAKEYVCRHCKRGFKGLVSGSRDVMQFEIVQTQGEDLPEWYHPKPRRV